MSCSTCRLMHEDVVHNFSIAHAPLINLETQRAQFRQQLPMETMIKNMFELHIFFRDFNLPSEKKNKNTAIQTYNNRHTRIHKKSSPGFPK